MITIGTPSRAIGLAPFMRVELQPILDVAIAGQCSVELFAQSRTPRPFELPPEEIVFAGILAARGPLKGYGPNGFHLASLTDLLLRASSVEIIAKRQDRHLYGEAAALARSGHSVVVIETDRRLEEIWGSFVAGYAQGRLREAEPGEGA
ncbi:hypothetical protein ACQKQD_24125 [Methylobacterium sp. NPDC080182]|uniref:hypothetical protein n=1 Tax=Methylobacterium sp. NPDC080182 TaxID=3390590 RepID=UPI003D05D01A